MVVLDTSIWIEFFKGNEPYYPEVNRLIESRSVITIEPIFGELLQGALNTKERDYITNFWKYIPKIEEHELFIKSGELSYTEKLVSKGIKLIDASIIHSVITNNYLLWTLDKKITNYMDDKYIFKVSQNAN